MANARFTPLLLALASAALAAQPVPSRTQGEEALRVTLPGTVHPRLANLEPLRSVAPDLSLERMVLVLKMAPEAKADLDHLLKDQQDPASPQYHRWLTPEAFGKRFGPSQAQLDAASLWLLQEGFTVHGTARSGLAVTFSGTAAQVGHAFRTAIMEYQVDGALHHGNASPVSIPQGLADFVGGVATLHDLRRTAQHRLLGRLASLKPHGPSATDASGDHYVGPGDFAAIYNLKPLLQAGTNGAGVTIGVVGRTDLQAADYEDFTGDFFSPYPYAAGSLGSLQTVHNGADPGLLDMNEQFEGDIDTQWATATAPGATISFVVSPSSITTDGSDLSSQYIVDNNLAQVMTSSFGTCEADMTATELTFFNQLWAQAAGQGISVFVATGDSGAAGCDDPSSFDATSGLGVSGMASTPYNVAVGGTMFNEGSGTYWSSSESMSTTATGYIPEAAWNESGTTTTGDRLWAGSGGASLKVAKPAWQTALTVSDGKRDLPDVALDAAGTHDPFLVSQGGEYYLGGGTSVASPCMAGIMALVVQKYGAQGNPNPTLYALAQSHPTVFHDVTSGNNSVPDQAGYSAKTGYDLATGLGSVDATLLVNNWVAGANPIAIPSVSTSATTVASGGSVNLSGSTTDSSSAALTYVWSFGDGTTATGSSAQHTYTIQGTTSQTLRATLTASDGEWTQSNAVAITVTPAAVSASITAPVLDLLAFSGVSIPFAATATSQNANPVWTYAWDFGDGSTAQGTTTSHTFASNTSSYNTVTVTASDGQGSSGQATIKVYSYTPWAMDLNFDNNVDVRDLLVLAGAWGTSATSATSLNGLYPWGCDFNGDGKIDDTDLNMWLNNFTPGAP